MPLDNNTPNIRNNPNEDRKKDETVLAAHDQAEKDMEEDADLNPPTSPADDLDEGEIARFEDKSDDVNI